MAAIIEVKTKAEKTIIVETHTLLERQILITLDKPDSFADFQKLLKENEETFFQTKTSLEPNSINIKQGLLLQFALFEAVKRNKLLEVKHLFSFKIPVNSVDHKGNTALILACGLASIDMIKLLISHGANLHHKNLLGFTPYLYAVKHKRTDVRLYLETAYPETVRKTSSRGVSVFMAAAEGGDLPFLKELLVLDPLFWQKNCSDGHTPFMSAAQGGSIPVLEFLLKLDPLFWQKNRSDGFTPFMEAAHGGSIPALEILLKIDPLFWQKNMHDGYTPFMSAAHGGSIPALEFLLTKDPLFWQKNCSDGRTPFMVAAAADFIPTFEFLLLRNPLFLNQPNNKGEVALHYAAYFGRLTAVRYLMTQGAKLNHLSNARKHEIDFARERGHNEIVEYLNQANSLFEWVKTGKLKEIKELVGMGHTLKFRNPEGDSLLHLALKHNQPNIAFYLLTQGLQKDWVNDNAETAIQLALKEGHLNAVVILYKKMMEGIFKCDISKSENDRIKALSDELETCINVAEAFKYKIDYENLAIEFDKKYWVKLAKELATLKKGSMGISDYHSRKDKLSKLIYSKTVRCMVLSDSLEGEEILEFMMPPEQTERLDTETYGKTDAETKRTVESETEEERYNRLFLSLKFALEGNVLESIMQIYLEITDKNIILPHISKLSHRLMSKDDIFLKLADFYRQQMKTNTSISTLTTSITSYGAQPAAPTGESSASTTTSSMLRQAAPTILPMAREFLRKEPILFSRATASSVAAAPCFPIFVRSHEHEKLRL